jgi:hypothetical protein
MACRTGEPATTPTTDPNAEACRAFFQGLEPLVQILRKFPLDPDALLHEASGAEVIAGQAAKDADGVTRLAMESASAQIWVLETSVQDWQQKLLDKAAEATVITNVAVVEGQINAVMIRCTPTGVTTGATPSSPGG